MTRIEELMRGLILVLVFATSVVTATRPAAAEKGRSPQREVWANGATSDRQQIATVLAIVPVMDRDMTYNNLGERLTRLGIGATRLDVGPVSADDVKLDPTLRRGDIDYRIYTTEPTSIVNQLCPLMTSFNLVRRGKQWIARDKTSNFLMNGYGHCRAPS